MFKIAGAIFVLGVVLMVIGDIKTRNVKKTTQTKVRNRYSKIGWWLLAMGGVFLCIHYFF